MPYWVRENRGYVGNGLPKRYRGIEFETIYKGQNGGKVEKFMSGKQSKSERAKNINALKILADKGYQYRLLPILEDGNKNLDAFNVITKKYTDIKVSDGVNGKNIVQGALKEASRQKANEVIIHLTKEPDSYRNMYLGLRTQIVNNRCKHIENIIVIFPNNNIKEYSIEAIKKKIKGKR